LPPRILTSARSVWVGQGLTVEKHTFWVIRSGVVNPRYIAGAVLKQNYSKMVCEGMDRELWEQSQIPYEFQSIRLFFSLTTILFLRRGWQEFTSWEKSSSKQLSSHIHNGVLTAQDSNGCNCLPNSWLYICSIPHIAREKWRDGRFLHSFSKFQSIQLVFNPSLIMAIGQYIKNGPRCVGEQ
jgi:hypothetical protein